MAKGRKLTISRSERFLGSYSNGHAHGSNGDGSSELREEDVWSMIDNSANEEDLESDNNSSYPRFPAENYGNISVRTRRRSSRDEHHIGEVPLAFQDSGRTTATPRNFVRQYQGHESVTTPRGRHVAASAPVNVQDWSKILRDESVESLPELDGGGANDESEMVPPHEYLAREYARSRNAAATSVFEGVGRTLKGRDMRRVRDAVWSQTGFDG